MTVGASRKRDTARRDERDTSVTTSARGVIRNFVV